MTNPSPTLPPTPSTIANLPLANTPLSGTEFVPISQNGVTVKVAAAGFTVVGPTGPAGPAGPTGATGPAGPPGSGSIGAGVIGNVPYYASSGSGLSPNLNMNVSNGALTLGVAASVQGSLALAGSVSGTTTLAAPTAGTGTMTLQAGADTLTGRATTDTFTNKTYDTAGTGNVFKLSGTAVTTASTILDIIGSTQGNILYKSGTTWVVLAPGTAGQLLATGGAAANPSWATVSAGLSGASAAQTLAGSSTTLALTPGGFNGNKSFGTSGYYQFPGGFTIQWGNTTGGIVASPTTINFPIAFPTACVAVELTFNHGTDYGSLAAGYNTISALSTTSFTAIYTAGWYWVAYGY